MSVSVTTLPAIDLDGVFKTFGSTKALQDVSMTVGVGEARALIGGNGAGKSTLISIITGLSSADEGTVGFPSAEDPGQAVACVYQRSTLVPGLTAAENIAMRSYPTSRGLVDWGEMHRRARAALDEWDCAWAAGRLVESLDPLHRKIVEICGALGTGAQILLLDEPTAGLDGDATRRLFDHIAALRERGVTIVYVSHYLEEIFEVCESVTVLRDGRKVMDERLEGLTIADLVNAMVGDVEVPMIPDVSAQDAGLAPVSRRSLLRVEGLAAAPALGRFDVEIAEGECVGLVGLDGSGIVEVSEVLAGLRSPDAGTVHVDGSEVALGDVRRCIDAGIGYLPEDRHHSGFVPGMAHEENVTLAVLSRVLNRIGFISLGKRRAIYAGMAERWRIKAASPQQATEELSGGNQQKVALARAFASEPKVLVLVNPTAGVDVAAKASIFESLTRALSGVGHAALIVSSDETEFAACSRLLVMFRGRIVGELKPPWSEHVLAAAVQGDITPAGHE
jgi:simple sugar transport system ATP-binding protein